MKRVIARVPNHFGEFHFNVVLVEVGDRYGLNDCHVHDGGRGVIYVPGNKVRPVDDPDAFVEFYDERYQHTEFGQFVSRYYARTLLGEPESFGHSRGGLDLFGGEVDWQVNAEEMALVRGAVAVATGRVAQFYAQPR